MKIIPISPNWAIDSLRIFIPDTKIKYLDTGQLQKTITLTTYGEELDEKHKMTEIKVGKSQSVYLQKSLRSQGLTKEPIEGIIILASAKLLGKNYFTAMNKNNIEIIYNSIIITGILHFTMETFLTADLSDIDYKNDFSCTASEFIVLREILKKSTKLTTIQGYGYNPPYTKKNKDNQYTNLGIDWGNRTGTANRNTNWKLYFKPAEMNFKGKTEIFKNQYFPNTKIPDMVRREFNIKNQERFKTLFGDKSFTLKTLLTLSQTEITNSFKTIVNYHLNIKPMETKSTSLNSPIKYLIKLFLNNENRQEDYQSQLDRNYLILIQQFELDFPDRKDRTKKFNYKKQALEIYSQLKDGNNPPEDNTKLVQKFNEMLFLD